MDGVVGVEGKTGDHDGETKDEEAVRKNAQDALPGRLFPSKEGEVKERSVLRKTISTFWEMRGNNGI
jgi:hypothetical protein